MEVGLVRLVYSFFPRNERPCATKSERTVAGLSTIVAPTAENAVDDEWQGPDGNQLEF